MTGSVFSRVVPVLLASHGLPLAYLLWDGARREVPHLVLWALLTGLSGAFALPWYWAVRPLRRGEVRKGGFVGTVVRGHFWLWTLLVGVGAAYMVGAVPQRSLGIGLLALLGIWGGASLPLPQGPLAVFFPLGLNGAQPGHWPKMKRLEGRGGNRPPFHLDRLSLSRPQLGTRRLGTGHISRDLRIRMTSNPTRIII